MHSASLPMYTGYKTLLTPKLKEQCLEKHCNCQPGFCLSKRTEMIHCISIKKVRREGCEIENHYCLRAKPQAIDKRGKKCYFRGLIDRSLLASSGNP